MHEQEILLKLTEIENLLRGKQSDLLNLNQAAQYLSISNSQLYKYTSQRKIPFHKPAGKYLYFFKGELNEWIKRNEECRLTNEEGEIMNDELEKAETAGSRPETEGTETGDGRQETGENQIEMFEEETEPP